MSVRFSVFILCSCVAVIINAGLIIPALATGAEGITIFSGFSSGPIAAAVNTGNGVAISGAASNQGIAVQGAIGTGKSGVGVRGVTYGTNSLAVVGEAKDTTDTTHSSIGVKGYSKTGNGIVGQTFANPLPLVVSANGVLGQDLAIANNFGAPVNNAGVKGYSKSGTGVVGASDTHVGVRGINRAGFAQPAVSVDAGVVGTSDLFLGVYGSTTGFSNTSAGVEGDATNGNGVVGKAGAGYGVYGASSGSVGVFGRGPTYGVYGTAPSGTGVFGVSSNAAGVAGQSDHGIGVYALGKATPRPDATTLPNANNFLTAALAVQGLGGAPLIIARNSSNNDVMSLDNSGNLILAGTSSTGGTPLVVHRTMLGRGVITYSTHQSVPSIEDFGEARLVNGQAYVRLDPTFAATIDPRANYLVFITPQGDTAGLYVTKKTRSGFVVREHGGASSALAFDYRIVAKPFDTNAPRLPLASTLPYPRSVALPPPIRSRPQFRTVPRLR